MQNNILSDTSCLILLDKIGKLDLLGDLFGNIIITKLILDEFAQEIPGFVKIESSKNSKYQKILEATVDYGEASLIALSLEIENPLIILDDRKARQLANELGIKVTGTIGILITAIDKGLITDVYSLIDDINSSNFRISDVYLDELRKRSR